MSASVTKTTIVYRRWDGDKGLQESEASVADLNKLFDFCLKAARPDVVDRIIIEGTDANNAPRTVVLTFQSVSGAGLK